MAEPAPGGDPVDEVLRPLALWAADAAGRVLPLFEAQAPTDTRPRAALDGIRVFGRGGRRTGSLRTAGWAAHAAARAVTDPAARSAARAASLAAATAYTHLDVPSVHQIRHVLGPAAYGAQARELAAGGPAGAAEIARAVDRAPSAVRQLVRRLLAPAGGRSRLSRLFVELDGGLRG